MIQKIDRMDENGGLIVRIEFHDTRLKNGYHIPNAITVTNGLDATFDMEIDNTWVNPPVTANPFELEYES